ncbi:acidic mammalian chitinase [Nematostella vectensis]|uniref:acidic mammalian chitinase n=1 Tax=Nematostella vectensis TaxID=45351 RepID=UPI0020772780|nr:acidic mammalian chitinase [Nematostella vectensis]
MRSLAFLLLVCSCSLVTAYHRVCYFTNWAQYRPDPVKFLPKDIDPLLCTHIVYAFAKIDPATNKIGTYEWNDDRLYKEINDLKLKNPSLKTLLAVGGWSHESGPVSPFSQMVASKSNRTMFISSLLQLSDKYDFDGFDLDWEYPASRGNSPPQDKQHFTILCEEMLDAFKRKAADTDKPRMLLTAAVSAGHGTVDAAYEVHKLAGILDWINLMTYDLHGPWEPYTGHHTALVGPPGDKLTVSYAVKYWMEKGMPCGKIALGMANYGHVFELSDPTKTALGAPANVNKGHSYPYYELCKLPLTKVTDNPVKAPYGYHGSQWIAYDDVTSLGRKVELIKKENLLGAMFWAIDLDDFGNVCGQGAHPLMGAVRYMLEGGGVMPPTLAPGVPTTIKPTCKAAGVWAGNVGMDSWCVNNCALGNCPPTICVCA